MLWMGNAQAATPIFSEFTSVYSSDFETGVDVNWSPGSTFAVDANLGSYNGNYSLTGFTTLTLNGLAPHSEVSLHFDLYLFSTWDGENAFYGKDYFSISGDMAGSWTFTNHQVEGQTYPGVPDEIYGTGASATHVYRNLDGSGTGLGFVFAHSGETLILTFGGPTTQTDEWWGIDNVQVSVKSVPLPTSAWLMLSGLFVFLLKRRNV